MKNKGFTLIELLIAVLIIGILAAISVPQYQKVIWKSKAKIMQQQFMELAKEEELYFLMNGRYAVEYNQLDIDFGLPYRQGVSIRPASNGGVDWSFIIENKDYVFGVTANGLLPMFISTAVFQSGPYTGCGFRYVHNSGGDSHYKNGTLYCIESFMEGKFCTGILGIPKQWNPAHGVNNMQM